MKFKNRALSIILVLAMIISLGTIIPAPATISALYTKTETIVYDFDKNEAGSWTGYEGPYGWPSSSHVEVQTPTCSQVTHFKQIATVNEVYTNIDTPDYEPFNQALSGVYNKKALFPVGANSNVSAQDHSYISVFNDPSNLMASDENYLKVEGFNFNYFVPNLSGFNVHTPSFIFDYTDKDNFKSLLFGIDGGRYYARIGVMENGSFNGMYGGHEVNIGAQFDSGRHVNVDIKYEGTLAKMVFSNPDNAEQKYSLDIGAVQVANPGLGFTGLCFVGRNWGSSFITSLAVSYTKQVPPPDPAVDGYDFANGIIGDWTAYGFASTAYPKAEYTELTNDSYDYYSNIKAVNSISTVTGLTSPAGSAFFPTGWTGNQTNSRSLFTIFNDPAKILAEQADKYNGIEAINFNYYAPNVNYNVHTAMIIFDYTDMNNYQALIFGVEGGKYRARLGVMQNGSSHYFFDSKDFEFGDVFETGRYVNVKIEYVDGEAFITLTNPNDETKKTQPVSLKTANSPAVANPALGFTAVDWYDNYGNSFITSLKVDYSLVPPPVDPSFKEYDFTKSDAGEWITYGGGYSWPNSSFAEITTSTYCQVANIKGFATVGDVYPAVDSPDYEPFNQQLSGVMDKLAFFPVGSNSNVTAKDHAFYSVFQDISTNMANTEVYESVKSISFNYFAPNVNWNELVPGIIYDYTDNDNYKVLFFGVENGQYVLKVGGNVNGSFVNDFDGITTTILGPVFDSGRYVNVKAAYEDDRVTFTFTNPDNAQQVYTQGIGIRTVDNPGLGFIGCCYVGRNWGSSFITSLRVDYNIVEPAKDAYTIEMEKGAYLRTIKPSGIRFGATAAKVEDGAIVSEYGILFMPTDKVGSDSITYEMLETANKNGAKAAAARKTGEELTVPEKFYGVLANVVPAPSAEEADLNVGNLKYAGRAFTTRGYVKYRLEGEEEDRIIYSDLSESRSVYGTAMRAATAYGLGDFSAYIGTDGADAAAGVDADTLKTQGMAAIAVLAENNKIFTE